SGTDQSGGERSSSSRPAATLVVVVVLSIRAPFSLAQRCLQWGAGGQRDTKPSTTTTPARSKEKELGDLSRQAGGLRRYLPARPPPRLPVAERDANRHTEKKRKEKTDISFKATPHEKPAPSVIPADAPNSPNPADTTTQY